MARERVDEGFHILQKGDKARGLLVGAGVKPTQWVKFLLPEAVIMLHLHANATIRWSIGWLSTTTSDKSVNHRSGTKDNLGRFTYCSNPTIDNPAVI